MEYKLDNIERYIEQAVDKFTREVKAIDESDNPIYKNKEVVKYEKKRLRDELDQQVAELKSEYDAIANQLIAEAEKKAARSTFKTPASAATIDTILADFNADVALAYSDVEREKALDKLKDAVVNMTFDEMAHVRRQLPAIAAKINDEATLKELQYINSILSEDLKTVDQLELERLKEKTASGGDIAYRSLRLANSIYSDYQARTRASMR